MPKNSKPRGMCQPAQVLNSLGKWVNNKFAGMRISRNTNVTDFTRFSTESTKRSKGTHTSPVKRTKFNDGHDNQTRLRHAATKAWHTLSS